jgi:hypothetical protein
MRTHTTTAIADYQRQRLYRWEHEQLRGRPENKDHYQMTVPEAQELADKAFQWWFNNREVKGPKVVSKGGSRTPARAHGSYMITLPNWAKRPVIVLHEVAHSIVATHQRDNKLVRDCDRGHGPYFVRVFIALMWHFLKMNRKELWKQATDYKLVIAPRSALPRPKAGSHLQVALQVVPVGK